MSELPPEDRAFLESIRDGWGPIRPVAPPSPAAIQARIEAKPWLAEAAPDPRAAAWRPFFGATVAAVGLCAVGLVAVRSRPPAAESTSAPAMVVAPPATAPSPAVEPVVAIDALPDAPPLVPGSKRQPRLGSRAPQAVRSDVTLPPSAPPRTLAEELELIRGAQSALRDGEADRALAAVSAHASRFPDGVLRDERIALAVLALCARGDVAGARRAKADLERSSPGSSHVQRLASSCAR